jgi:hypothetical protein
MRLETMPPLEWRLPNRLMVRLVPPDPNHPPNLTSVALRVLRALCGLLWGGVVGHRSPKELAKKPAHGHSRHGEPSRSRWLVGGWQF